MKYMNDLFWSATVDSSLFSRYFGNCPVISAEGRTHPVSTYFLEDVYENLKYCLPSDSPASGTFMMPRRGKPGSNSVDNHRGKKNLVLSAWGDESLLLEDYINPYYISDVYESYSERTRQNLKSLNEDVIDFDLLEDLICYIDENYPSGSILVFLPGVAEIDMLVDKLTASFRFGGVSSDLVLPLHSSLASIEQRKVFLSPPQNIRKVFSYVTCHQPFSSNHYSGLKGGIGRVSREKHLRLDGRSGEQEQLGEQVYQIILCSNKGIRRGYSGD